MALLCPMQGLAPTRPLFPGHPGHRGLSAEITDRIPMTLQIRLDMRELTERLPLVGPHASPRPSAPPPPTALFPTSNHRENKVCEILV